jgi:hypothetical protein
VNQTEFFYYIKDRILPEFALAFGPAIVHIGQSKSVQIRYCSAICVEVRQSPVRHKIEVIVSAFIGDRISRLWLNRFPGNFLPGTIRRWSVDLRKHIRSGVVDVSVVKAEEEP